MTVLDIKLKVPTASADCAKWISKQEPAVVAEALALAEISFNAVRREISESETSRLLTLHKDQLHELQLQLQIERDKTHKVAEDLQASCEASLAADRTRYNASIEALQRQLRVAADAHRATQKLLTEERHAHIAARDEEIQSLKLRLSSESSDAALRLSSELKALHEDYQDRISRLQQTSLESQNLTRKTLEVDNSSLREQLKTMAEEASATLKTELKNLREAHETRLSCTQEESRRIIDGLNQQVQNLICQVTETRSAQQLLVEESEMHFARIYNLWKHCAPRTSVHTQAS